MASGHENRANRPNTWLLRPTAARVKKTLANPEPSTHGPLLLNGRPFCSAAIGREGPCVDGSELARTFFTCAVLGRCGHVFGLY